MNLIARVMRFLFWLLVLSWGVALLRRLVTRTIRGAMPAQMDHDADGGVGVGPGSEPSHGGMTARKLVRDPVCGMHVAEELSIPLREGGELVHFCSMECRDRYAKNAQPKAANA